MPRVGRAPTGKRGLGRIGIVVGALMVCLVGFGTWGPLSQGYDDATRLGTVLPDSVVTYAYPTVKDHVERLAGLAGIDVDSLARMTPRECREVAGRWSRGGGVDLSHWRPETEADSTRRLDELRVSETVADSTRLLDALEDATVIAKFVRDRERARLWSIGPSWLLVNVLIDAIFFGVLLLVWLVARWIVRGFWGHGRARE